MLSILQVCAGIPGGHGPLTFYHLLGISPDEQDAKVIEEAALDRACHVRAYQLTQEAECTRLLNEIALSMATLLDPVNRQEYDQSLGKHLRPVLSKDQPSLGQKAALREAVYAASSAEAPEDCDVRLVWCLSPRHLPPTGTVIFLEV